MLTHEDIAITFFRVIGGYVSEANSSIIVRERVLGLAVQVQVDAGEDWEADVGEPDPFNLVIAHSPCVIETHRKIKMSITIHHHRSGVDHSESFIYHQRLIPVVALIPFQTLVITGMPIFFIPCILLTGV